MGKPNLLWGMAVVAACFLTGLPLLFPNAARHSEYEVKAAYLYNFGRFIEWPQNGAPAQARDFAICVLGQDPFGQALDATVSGEQIDGKNVVPVRIAKADEAGGCRVVFISPSEGRQLKEILAILAKSSILTVSDMPKFVDSGGMVEFVISDQRVRFEINLAAARGVGLTLSSELLKVAANVRQGPRVGD